MSRQTAERSCLSLLHAARRTLDAIAQGDEGRGGAELMADVLAEYLGHEVTDQPATARLLHPSENTPSTEPAPATENASRQTHDTP